MHADLSRFFAPTTAAESSAASRSWGRRLGEATALVAAWMALGFALKLDPNAYLVLGVPLAVVFQRFVARAPLRAAWVAAAPRAAFGGWGVTIAILLALLPALEGLGAVLQRSWSTCAWAVAGMFGAVAAAYAIRSERGRLGRSVLVAAAAAIPGVLVMVGYSRIHPSAAPKPLLVAIGLGAASFVEYVPICFALEEVVFRGVLDAHVTRSAPDRARSWITAVVLSALWGTWHLPLALAGGAPIVLTVVKLVGVHVVVGLALTAAWRRTGSLVAPALAHALVDAVRNGLM